MGLTQYNKKRHFDDTPEPAGKAAKRAAKKPPIFVIQRHEASSLHYDFRLEAEGVLKSWAVPKGPSLNTSDKRLAVQVEDHPVSYAGFEGDIPAGNYGAGHVDVWDKGSYEPIDDKGAVITEAAFLKALNGGSIRFRIRGKKINGAFKLFRMKGAGDKNWLLTKSNDEFATEEDFDAEELPHSLRGFKPPKKGAKPKPEPEAPAPVSRSVRGGGNKVANAIRPMLARLHEGPFDDPDWLFEIKWDGYRAIAECKKKEVLLYSRNTLDFSDRYREIADALASFKLDAVLDGEIVVLDERGLPSFQLLQNAGSGDVNLHFYVFDILYHKGKSVEGLPLLERKALLEKILPEHPFVHVSDHVVGKGKDLFKVARKKGLEGTIAKKADSIYVEGGRSGDWLKIKYVQTDEAIICGYTAPKGSRKMFGALILGAYQDGKLTYIGHTGTGFNAKTLQSLHATMQSYVHVDNPFGTKVPVNDKVTWLRPELVCAIKFTERTEGGILRHPVFIALRDDKSAGEVTGADRKEAPAAKKKSTKAAAAAPVKQNSMKAQITHPEKLYWPEEGITKGDMIAYYESVSKVLLPYLKGRPLSLRRNPNGIADPGFFHKDAGEHAPEFVHTLPVWSESSEKDVDYIVCNNLQTLIYLANLGCIELNPWHSREGHLENPDYLMLDLDPADKNTFEQVIEAAKAVKSVLDEAGCDSYCKTSGSTGLHIYVPLRAKYPYEQVAAFAEIVAGRVVELLPEFTSIERNLKKRGQAIYIDHQQNNIGQTVASVYSLRPKPGAPVSTPLEWKEVKKGLEIKAFNIRNTVKRLEKKGDLFRPVLGKGADLLKALKKLGG